MRPQLAGLTLLRRTLSPSPWSARSELVDAGPVLFPHQQLCEIIISIDVAFIAWVGGWVGWGSLQGQEVADRLGAAGSCVVVREFLGPSFDSPCFSLPKACFGDGNCMSWTTTPVVSPKPPAAFGESSTK